MDAFSALSRPTPEPGRERLRVDTVPAPDGETMRLTVSGELDRLAATRLFHAVEDALRATPATIETDLSGVTFLDSSGIRCLLNCRRRTRAAGCAFVLSHPSPTTGRVLQITGLLAVFGLGEPCEQR